MALLLTASQTDLAIAKRQLKDVSASCTPDKELVKRVYQAEAKSDRAEKQVHELMNVEKELRSALHESSDLLSYEKEEADETQEKFGEYIEYVQSVREWINGTARLLRDERIDGRRDAYVFIERFSLLANSPLPPLDLSSTEGEQVEEEIVELHDVKRSVIKKSQRFSLKTFALTIGL
jgi:hypothetical protein